MATASVATNAAAASQEATLIGVAVFTAFVRTRFYYLEQGNRGAHYISQMAHCVNEATMASRDAFELNAFGRVFAAIQAQFDPTSSWEGMAVTSTITNALQNVLPSNATSVPPGDAPTIAATYAVAVLATAVATAEAAGGTDFDDSAMAALVGNFLVNPASPDAAALAATFESDGGVRSCMLPLLVHLAI